MEEKTLETVISKGTEWRIGNTVIDLHPIRLKDWPDASKLMYLLSFESLADIAYIAGIEGLKTLIDIVARASELPEGKRDHFTVLDDITDSDFKWLRQIISAQNDINMDRLLDQVAKISGNPKNVKAPNSPLSMG